MVPKINGIADIASCDNQENERPVNVTSQKTSLSSLTKIDTDGMSCVRENFQVRGFSERTTNIIMSSWRTGTKKQYQTFIRRWIQYTVEREIDKFHPSLGDVLNFFTSLFDKGLGYSSLNTARGALSAIGLKIENFMVGSHPLVIRYMRGIFNLRPTRVRYTEVWDVNKVLCYLRKLSPVSELSLKYLTLKLTMLIALTNAARTQTVHLLSVNNMKRLRTEYVLQLDGLLKQSRPNYNVCSLSLRSYPPDRRLCVLFVLKEYLKRTKTFRGSHSFLLVSYRKPFNRVTRDTISRWIKTVLTKSGIDTNIFGAHSVRAASTSKAKNNGVPIQDIINKAGWTNSSTFAKFYDKKIVTRDRFAEGVLRK